MPTAAACPEPESVLEYIEGALQLERREHIKSHLDSCAECLRTVAALASQHYSQISAGTDDGTPGLELVAGEAVGRFVVLHPVGRGGMGTVYAAYDPKLDRKVALKILHSGGRAANERLMAEARLLAKVEHPNVMSIFDVGTHRDAVYMAMPFIASTSCVDYFKGAARARVLRYFEEVGRGLQAAHTLGLVHRDVKPANLLVGPSGSAVVSDFGLAAEGSEIGNEVAGTPSYMAPEQALGQAGPLADQYSFCVSLVQVLTGHLHKPGDHVPKELRGTLRTALERGLHDEPERRYEDMDALLSALSGRKRKRLWVVAGAAAALLIGLLSYRVAAPSAAGEPPCQGGERLLAPIWNPEIRDRLQARFAELTGFGSPLWQRASARFDAYESEWLSQHRLVCEATRVHKDQSETTMETRMQCLEQRRSELSGLLQALATAPVEELAKTREAQVLLIDPASCSAPGAPPPLPSDPKLRATIEQLRSQAALWHARAALGQLDEAALALAPLQAEAKALGYPALEAEMAQELGQTLAKLGRFTEAESALRNAIGRGTESRYDSLVAQAWLQLSWLHGYHQERYADAEADLENGRAFATRVAASGPVLMSYQRNAGWLALKQGKLDDALASYQRALSIAKEAGLDPRDLAMLHSDLGSAHLSLGDVEAAAGELGIAFAQMSTALGPQHPDTLTVHNNFAALLKAQGKFPEAIAEFEAVLQGFRTSMPASEVYQGQVLNNLATIYADLAQDLEAEKLYREALATLLVAHPEEKHPDIARVLHGLATVVQQTAAGYAEAEALHARSLAMKEELLGAAHPSVAIGLSGLGDLYIVQGRKAEAREALSRAIKILRESVGSDHPQTEFVRAQLDELGGR